MSVHQALLFHQLSWQGTVLQHTGPALSEEQLDALSIAVVAGEVAQVEADAGGLTGVRLSDGTGVQRDALMVAARFTARVELLGPLGLKSLSYSSVDSCSVPTTMPMPPG